jgi:PKD repeat protein
MGGTLAVDSFTATGLGSSPTATATANQTAASVSLGTLANYGGTLAPGNTNAPGRTVITGNYAVSNAAAVLAVDLGGATPANAFTNAASYYDYVSVSGTASLGGSLKVSLINNFQNTISSNATFTVLTAAGGLSGAFTNVVGGRVPVANVPGGSFQVVTSATSVILSNYNRQTVAADFTASPTTGVRPLLVTFTDNSTGTITNRTWDFGDGSGTNTSAPSLAHTFTVAGTNVVVLVVSGPAGASTNSQAIVVTVPAAPVINSLTRLSDTQLLVTGTNGAGTNYGYLVLSSTNLALPVGNWRPVATNSFGVGGGFSFTNAVSPVGAGEFFRLLLR